MPPTTTAAVSPTNSTGGKKLAARLSSHSAASKRNNKAPAKQQDIHPVLKLGYETMCEVHCNGLQGLFLGGHDRDLFIQCTSHEYADLPLIDASQGGCIMSCSHFERAAGRELSKKWKESIHVVGEGEGSKATLLAWLKRQADAMAPDVVGSSVWVCWCNEAEFYHGTVVSFNRESGKHKVRYNERVVEELHLPVEKIDFGQVKPQVPKADPAEGHVWPPVARPVLQQDLPNALPSLLTSSLNALQQPVTPGRGRRSAWSGGQPLACNETLQDSGEGYSGLSHSTHLQQNFDDSTAPAVPKKPRTGLREPQSLRHAISMPATGRGLERHPPSLLAGLASLATATSLAMVGSHHDQQQPSGMSTSRAFAAPLLGSLSSVQQMAILSAPPVAGLQESDVTVMSCWMNKVALQLDDVLVDGVHMLAEPVTVAGMTVGPGIRHAAQHGSPSARFQNLLIHARSKGTVQGYYEAMLTRYDHFRDKPAALMVKMAEFIMAALTDDLNKQYNDGVFEQHRPSDVQT
ncbi:MAG: SMCA5 SWI SNF related matrix associated act (ISS) [Trebouxia sp. A1-2]|nr:MAG: SMCA5 SWI SNF related matrix associated act (ISS) [Trebouxia sp. A1-2]